MKNKLLIGILACTVLGLSGCSQPQTKEATVKTTEATVKTTETIVEKTEEAKELRMTLKFDFGARTGIYSGNLEDGKPNGYGTFETKNEEGESWTYEGEWLGGHFHGEGKTIWHGDSKRKQEGTYQYDSMNGYGKMYINNELVYEGEWKDGTFDGLGKFYEDGKLVYEGSFLSGSAVDDVDESTQESTEMVKEEKPSKVMYIAGSYKVGVDIPAGEYKLYESDDNRSSGYYKISSDANGNQIVSNDNFDNFRYIEILDGQYLKLSGCEIRTAEAPAEDLKVYIPGQYKVGTDIPAGEYKLYKLDNSRTSGYYKISSDANGKQIVSNDLFENSSYIEISDGQYLKISSCEIRVE